MKVTLPQPSPEALAHSEQLKAFIFSQISQNPAGKISFADYMQLALYAPALGYYVAGSKKFGPEGDFTTAPEISPLFGRCIANQCALVLESLSAKASLLELGAGTGRLAQSILEHLETLQALPEYYYILEVSPDLRAIQQQFLQSHLTPALYQKCVWLETLPMNFVGMIIANEVLDALAVRRFIWTPTQTYEIFVSNENNTFTEIPVPADPLFSQQVAELQTQYGQDWPSHYQSEISDHMQGLVRSLAATLSQGMILFIDYGFKGSEYYHLQRHSGTLMCHYRHHSHSDPYFYPGLQDITAHVDFTQVAKIAQENQLRVAGFTTQAGFLLASGLMEAIPSDATLATQLKMNQHIQLLTSPAEMGELFKVLALNKDCQAPLRYVDFLSRTL